MAKSLKNTRIESDSIGQLEVPAGAYYGVQALRAKQNFAITGLKLRPEFIKSMAYIKKAAAKTNKDAKKLDAKIAKSIMDACDEILAGKFMEDFVVDPIQGGAGTSSNMNINEVVANRATEMMGGALGSYNPVHPNDHVNMAQSTNDVIPTAGKLTTLMLLEPLYKEMDRLEKALQKKAKEFDGVIKMGRTQLQDAVPMRLGQTFRSYATMVARDINRLHAVASEMYAVNMGGTAIGSCINASDYYVKHIAKNIADLTGYPIVSAKDLFDATENLDCFVAVSGVLKTCAVDLSKMSNDLRLLSSGPRTGLGEINLPGKQNGSSIMPGKVNPVIPEVVSQVAFKVIGNDMTITMAAEGGQMELNAFEPVAFYSLFESITAMTGAVNTLVDNCITGITANEKHCKDLLEQSVCMATPLCQYVGYAKSAEIAKEALKTGKTVRAIALKKNILPAAELDKALDASKVTGK